MAEFDKYRGLGSSQPARESELDFNGGTQQKQKYQIAYKPTTLFAWRSKMTRTNLVKNPILR